MNFLNIGKIRGVLFSAIIVTFYYYWWLPYLHYQWFGFYPVYGLGHKFVLVGLIMTQVVVIQPGDTARLTFFGGELDREWYNGLACMPNVFHTTIVMFKFALLWGLAVLRNEKYKRYEEPTVHVDVSDSNFKYNANVEMTYTQAQLNRGLGVLLKLFCDYKRVPEEYYVASFGYRVLIVGVILVCLNSSLAVAQVKLNEAASAASRSIQQVAPPSR